jgi:Flp pilus assembly protein TadB
VVGLGPALALIVIGFVLVLVPFVGPLVGVPLVIIGLALLVAYALRGRRADRAQEPPA